MLTEEDYIEAHIDAEPAELHRLYRQTHLHRLYPRMCTDHIQGRLLVMLTRLVKPRRVLELGTFSGYSALCFAEGMAPDGHVDTVEVDTEHAEELEELFSDKPVTLHTGDAEELLPSLLEANEYDLVFIDANKRRYVQYYQIIRPYLKSGAVILADNTLWADKVLNVDAHDPQTEGIRAFNDLVAADEGVEKVILPLRDGLTLIRVK
ncbi:MAG: O-methyltransferase [Muribaculaceae bacterium]|jgi:predicted O-methyltransferase YrrM|nr:O-methyltransferase [Muribaculaceae bacterium]